MEFQNPTTRAEMMEILRTLFQSYRLRKLPFEPHEIGELNLQRLPFEYPTEEEYLSKAEILLAPTHVKEIEERKEAADSEIIKINVRIAALEETKKTLIAKAEEIYKNSVKSAKKQAIKSGVSSSDIIFDKIAAFEKEKNAEILSAERDYAEKLAELQAQLTVETDKKQNAETYFLPIHAAETAAKVSELKDATAKEAREAFKYNNALDEKEQRYVNTAERARADLEIRYDAIRAGGYSDDELVEMGYYGDVLRCMTAYYNTLTPSDAYDDLKESTDIIVYIGRYYNQMLYHYKSAALTEIYQHTLPDE